MSELNTPRLMAAAKEFNIGKDTLVDFLVSKGFNNDDLNNEITQYYDLYTKYSNLKFKDTITSFLKESLINKYKMCKCLLLGNKNAIKYGSFLFGTTRDQNRNTKNNNPENFRFLRIKPKLNVDSIAEVFNIRLEHGTIITMCGDMQNNFTHGIEKENKNVSKRISLSFRQMI